MEPVVEALRAEPLARLPLQADLGPAVGRFENRVLMVPVAGLDTITAGRRGHRRPGPAARDRAFTGHLTLARVGAPPDRPSSAGRRAGGGRWWVDEVCLVETRLAPTGPRYDVVQRFALA